MAGKIPTSLSFVSHRVLNNSQIVSSFRCFVRLLHNEKYGKYSVDVDDKKEQFSGPIPTEHLKIKYSRSPGPGGQNVNKVNTKVDLRFHVMTAHWIPSWIRKRLHEKEVNQINKEGELVIQSSKFRSQEKNLEDGVEKIREILKEVSYIPKETSDKKKNKISELIKLENKRRLQEKKIRAQKKHERSKNE